uniref:Plastid acyl carrier protein n=1 Tax=Eustigmatophyceae sp. Chic 10/23 P-6w TaxID=1446905 RepID=A0A3R5WW07_9STRA|nr:plastid acyl carrier protein [Eustigmatophyceae sp. Chic 10/23 P-6w]
MRLSIITFLACAASAVAFLPVMPTTSNRLAPRTAIILKAGVSDTVRSIILKSTGDDPKVTEYLSSNADDKAELSELGFDSLDMVEFSITLQKEFNLADLSEEEFAQLKTVGDVVKFIESSK